jgi:hypothetical protein
MPGDGIAGATEPAAAEQREKADDEPIGVLAAACKVAPRWRGTPDGRDILPLPKEADPHMQATLAVLDKGLADMRGVRSAALAILDKADGANNR